MSLNTVTSHPVRGSCLHNIFCINLTAIPKPSAKYREEKGLSSIILMLIRNKWLNLPGMKCICVTLESEFVCCPQSSTPGLPQTLRAPVAVPSATTLRSGSHASADALCGKPCCTVCEQRQDLLESLGISFKVLSCYLNTVF